MQLGKKNELSPLSGITRGGYNTQERAFIFSPVLRILFFFISSRKSVLPFNPLLKGLNYLNNIIYLFTLNIV